MCLIINSLQGPYSYVVITKIPPIRDSVIIDSCCSGFLRIMIRMVNFSILRSYTHGVKLGPSSRCDQNL